MTSVPSRGYIGISGRNESFGIIDSYPIFIDAGDGNDEIDTLDANDFILGGLGRDYILAFAGDDIIYGDRYSDDSEINVDTTLAAAADAIWGDNGRDVIFAGGGRNYVNGGSDNDHIFGGNDSELLQGGTGNDIVSGGGGEDILFGGTASKASQDAFIASYVGSITTTFDGITDNSTPAKPFDEKSFSGLHVALNETGNDYLDGGDGNDSIYGQDGTDTLLGGVGNDILDGGAGADLMNGGGGDDTFYVDNATDKVVENSSVGSGLDSVIASVSYTLAADTVVERFVTGSKTGTTTLNFTGNNFAQTIVGNYGVNTLNGVGGNDVLSGLDGNDKLYGGLGNDTLIGGLGNDLFVFNSAPNTATNHDIISDFSNGSGNNDTISLQNDVFTTLATGSLGGAFAANTTGAATQADDRIIYETDTGNLFYDTNGSAAGGSVLFATLTGHPAITVNDFVVY